MNTRAVYRPLCIGVLLVGAFASLAFLLFAIGMEGMRHSYPSGFDAYYWIPGLPLILSTYLLVSAWIHIAKKSTIVVDSVFGIFALWWLVLMYDEGADIEFFCAGFIGILYLTALCARTARSVSKR